MFGGRTGFNADLGSKGLGLRALGSGSSVDDGTLLSRSREDGPPHTNNHPPPPQEQHTPTPTTDECKWQNARSTGTTVVRRTLTMTQHRRRNGPFYLSYKGWEDHRANHTIPPFWLDDRPPLLRHVDVRPAAGWLV
ncbi:hypothetical protein ANN_01387 [Periplaneta americana]|uniref:Uncharacterized protein n=1 Tax=Periplaneta americana TaxID=6978 RepID=A0ABQ8TTG2_PERAM|nr:hypothetical protein ANN_01387 [Periplaneta americana]